LIPGAAAGTGASGELRVNSSSAGFIPVAFNYVPSSLNTSFFVASRAYRVKSITWRVDAVGTDAGAVTALVKKAASGAAISAGTDISSTSFNLKTGANTNQPGTLAAAADLEIAAGTAIGVSFTGTLTSATGSVTVTLAPL
jgi:hypothetical protein